MKLQLTKDKIYIALGITILLIAGLIYSAFFMPNEISYDLEVPMAFNFEEQEEQEEQIEYIETRDEPYLVTIFISGEVNDIGVFTLPYGSRIVDALEKANGPTSNADLNRINLASLLKDEQHIIIPNINDVFSEDFSEIERENLTQISSSLVNINTANTDTLQTLPRIGPVLAENIIKYRNENGFFNSISEIQNTPGIGSGIFNNIKSLITVDW